MVGSGLISIIVLCFAEGPRTFGISSCQSEHFWVHTAWPQTQNTEHQGQLFQFLMNTWFGVLLLCMFLCLHVQSFWINAAKKRCCRIPVILALSTSVLLCPYHVLCTLSVVWTHQSRVSQERDAHRMYYGRLCPAQLKVPSCGM